MPYGRELDLGAVPVGEQFVALALIASAAGRREVVARFVAATGKWPDVVHRGGSLAAVDTWAGRKHFDVDGVGNRACYLCGMFPGPARVDCGAAAPGAAVAFHGQPAVGLTAGDAVTG